MVPPSAMAQAVRVYPNSKICRRAFYLGASVCWRGDLRKLSPYQTASGADKAWHAGFAWAFEVNSVMIGAAQVQS